MRVLFDGYWWVRGPGANKTVLREFVNHWVEAFPDDEVVLALRHRDRAQADLPQGVTVDTLRSWPHGLACMSELPLLARRHRADWTLSHNFTPLVGRTAVFIHDLMYQERAEWFTRAELVYFTPMALSARRAEVVMTSTRTEAARMERLNPMLSPVHPVGLAVPTALTRAVPRRPDEVTEDTFSVVVGRLNVRKNLANVIQAAGRAQTITAQAPLFVVGDSQHSGVNTELTPGIRSVVERGQVRFLGRVSDGELRWLYEHARFAACLSIDEGFGLPPLEALNFGAPVLVSDIPVFTEVLGGQGVAVDPLDIDAIARGMDSLLGAARPAPTDRGYSWESSVHSMRSLLTAGGS